jgi:hypothetical protein
VAVRKLLPLTPPVYLSGIVTSLSLSHSRVPSMRIVNMKYIKVIRDGHEAKNTASDE